MSAEFGFACMKNLKSYEEFLQAETHSLQVQTEVSLVLMTLKGSSSALADHHSQQPSQGGWNQSRAKGAPGIITQKCNDMEDEGNQRLQCNIFKSHGSAEDFSPNAPCVYLNSTPPRTVPCEELLIKQSFGQLDLNSGQHAKALCKSFKSNVPFVTSQ